MTFPETFNTCTVSTAHLPEKLAKAMEENDQEDEYPTLCYEKLNYGYRIWTDSDSQLIPDEIRRIVLAAEKAGCKWIEFDCDAEKVAGFQTWNW